MLLTVVAGLVMLSVLVVIHEAGHLIVAKLLRMDVSIFSIGMGPRVAGVKLGGTDYRISAFPVGGYVLLAGADAFGEGDPDQEISDPFLKRPVWQRFLVMVAGPVANLILPLFVFTAVLVGGQPQTAPTIGIVDRGSSAERAGFQPSDTVLTVGGSEVVVWMDLVRGLDPAASGGTVPVEVERGGRSVTLQVSGLDRDQEGYVDMAAFGVRAYSLSSRVGVDDPGSPAAVAGLRTGDIVTAVDGVAVDTWSELQAAVAGRDRVELAYLREGVAGAVSLARDPSWVDALPGPEPRDPFGLLPSIVFVGSVVPESPAALAGVRSGDRIVAVDDESIRSWSEMVGLVGRTAEQHHEGAQPRSLTLHLVRDGAPLAISLTPEMVREVVGTGARYRPVMGIGPFEQAYRAAETARKFYGVAEAVPIAVDQVRDLFSGTLLVLGNIFTGELKPQESLGGPIEIFRMAGEGADRGLFAYAQILGTISISLGIINLLPVPVLDGGQILLYLLEGIRGRPVSLAIREKMQMVGVLAMAALFLFVCVNDLNRWWTSG